MVQTQQEAEKSGKLSYYLSWFLLFLALCVLSFGCYVAYQAILSKPKAGIIISNDNLSISRQQDIKQRLNQTVEGNFFTANLHHIVAQLQEIDWIEAVKVSRQWPNGIAVAVVPRHAIARYGSERFMSHDGKVFSATDKAQLKDAQNLPVLYGPVHKTAEMMRQYKQVNTWFSPLNIKLNELSLTEGMTWFLKFDNGLRVIVDREGSQAKIFRLSQALQTNMASVRSKIDAVDLRYRNGMAVMWQSGEQPNNLKSLIKQ